MMKKGLIFVCIFLLYVGGVGFFVFAQESLGIEGTKAETTTGEESSNPAIPPGLPTPGDGLLGDFNPDTGKPRNLETFQKYADYYRDREQDQDFLKQEWTNLFAENKVMGPIFFYTDMFFAFFNPLWNIIFGVPFSWSWAFFLTFSFWLFFIFILYDPMRGLTGNQVVGFFASLIIASLIGLSGAIRRSVEFFSVFTKNVFVLFLVFLLLFLLIVLYKYFMSKLIKESSDIELEESEENIRGFGKMTRDSHRGV